MASASARPLETVAAALRHRPARAARSVERDIYRAMSIGIGPARPGVIGREHAADEGDDGEAEGAVVAQRVDIPPAIAARTQRPHRRQVRHQAMRREPSRNRRHRHARARMHAAPREIEARQPRPRARTREGGRPPVRRLTVDRAARRRKQPARSPPASCASSPSRRSVQAAIREPSKDRLLASAQLLWRNVACPSPGGRVDERKQSFFAARTRRHRRDPARRHRSSARQAGRRV